MKTNFILVEGSDDLSIYRFIIKKIFNMDFELQNICSDINCEFKSSGGFHNFKYKLKELLEKYEKNLIDINRIGIIGDLDNKSKSERQKELEKIFSDVFKEYKDEIKLFTFICEDFKEIEFLLKESKTLDSKVAECFYDNFKDSCKNLDINDYQIEKLAIKYWVDVYLNSYCCKEIDPKEKNCSISRAFNKKDIDKCFDIKHNKFLDNFQNFLNNFN